MNSKDICSQILEGKISIAKNHIVEHYGDVLDSKIAHLVLVALSRTVSHKDHYASIPINDVFHLTIICCNNVFGLKDNNKENILLSLYHVIKFFCKQKLFNKVLDLLNFVKQHCINENFKSDVYNYYIPLFHNYVLQNVKDLDGEILSSIINYSLQLHMLLKTNEFSSFISKVKLYTSIFKYPTIDIVYRTKFCSDILNLLENLDTTENQNDIKEIYLTLLNTLNIIMHCVAIYEDDIFPNFINDHFRKSCLIMRKHCNIKEYMECIEILEYFSRSLIKNIKDRNVKDLQTLTECDKKLRALIRKRGLNPIAISTCIQISKILRILFEYFQNCKTLWSKYLPIETQTELLSMIDILGQFLSKNTLEIEKCCADCKFETDIYHATVTTSYTGLFTINSVRLNLSSEEFHILSLRCLTLCCKFLNKLKEEGCEKYIQIWKLIGTGIYNTAVILYRNKDYKFSKLYSQLFITNVISLEGIENPEMCFANSLGASLHLCAVICSFLQEKKECLLYLVLTLLLSVEYKKKAFQTWVMIKSNDTNDEEGLKSTTVHHILLNQKESLKEIYPLYIYNQKDCENLLLDELEYYCENWQSKIPLSSVCNELCKISENLIIRTRSFVMTWEKIVPMGESNFIKNLEETIEMNASASNTNSKMCLSVLYYIQYQYKMNETVQINIAHMNEADIPSKRTPLKPYEEPPNPNDTCDIVPAYYNMRVDNLLKLYEILDSALNIWDILLKDNKEILDPNVISILNIGHFIKLTAYEFRMQFFINKMLNTWILYYKFMKQLNNKREIIMSIGFIIEYSDCKSEVIKALEREAEDLLCDFDKNDPILLEICLTYYINKSSGYLKNDMINDGYSALQKAEKYAKEANYADLKICKARILHLKTCYLLLPCLNKILNHDENFLTNAQNSFTIAAEYYTTKTAKCPYLLSILFEISLANGWMYKWLRLPREVRCYTKESILLAQKCVLPIRIAQFLSLLAFTDLLDMRYSDCEVKLNGLTKMLCYASNACSNVTFEKLPIPIEKFQDAKLESPVSELSEMDNSIPIIQAVLDYSATQRKHNIVTGSPEFRRKSFVFPEFMKHSKNCDCFMCSNSEYQKLILDIIHLEALLNSHQNRSDQGQGYFKGGLSMCETLCKKSDEHHYKSIKLSEKEKIFACDKNISQSYCTFLLNYSYFLAQRNTLTEANNIIEKIFNILRSVKHVNIYFWNELMIQKYNLFVEQDIEEKSFNIENELFIPENKGNSVTPKNIIHLTVSPIKKGKPVKSFKKLTFDLSEDEKDENLPKTPQHTKNIYLKFQTPAKTPVVPKIKIYTPKTVKSIKTTSKVTAVSSSPNQSGKKKIINKQLQERTKLLTEKLKAEKKTLLKDHSNISDPNLETSSSKVEVRKKLLDDLVAVTDSIDKLSIKDKNNINTHSKTIIPTSSLKNVDSQRKKYNRIKIAPTSSSSDSSLDSNGTRKSTRVRKQNNKS